MREGGRMSWFKKNPTVRELEAFKYAAELINKLKGEYSVYTAQVNLKAALAANGYTPRECQYAIDKLFE